jgi:hypothetical protein
MWALLFSFGGALADAATHELSLAPSTIAETDCGNGTCIPVCSFKAKLKNVGHRDTRPIAVRLQYPTDTNDDKVSNIVLYFGELKPGADVESMDEAHNTTCEVLKIDQIEADCPEETDAKCPGFYNIDIPETKVPVIAHQRIVGK